MILSVIFWKFGTVISKFLICERYVNFFVFKFCIPIFWGLQGDCCTQNLRTTREAKNHLFFVRQLRKIVKHMYLYGKLLERQSTLVFLKIRTFCWPFLALGIACPHISVGLGRRGGNISLKYFCFYFIIQTSWTNNYSRILF